MERELFKKISEDTVLNYDILSLIVGNYIGSGVFRDVYEYAPDNNYVVKIAKDTRGVICNIKEFDLWEEVNWFTGPSEWVKNWFAPVKEISLNGSVLIMRRTEEKPNKKRPEEVPSFINDYHSKNFGWIGNRFVCHDYGSQINFYGKISKKMKKSFHEI